jgi:hypothetical protein
MKIKKEKDKIIMTIAMGGGRVIRPLLEYSRGRKYDSIVFSWENGYRLVPNLLDHCLFYAYILN